MISNGGMMGFSISIAANTRNELYKFSVTKHGQNGENKTTEFILMTGGNYLHSNFESDYFGQKSYGVIDVKSKSIDKVAALAQINKVLGSDLEEIKLKKNFDEFEYSNSTGNLDTGIKQVLDLLAKNIDLTKLLDQPGSSVKNADQKQIKIGVASQNLFSWN